MGIRTKISPELKSNDSYRHSFNHPLIDENKSTDIETQFSRYFEGTEIGFVVNKDGSKRLSNEIMLEMAREAIASVLAPAGDQSLILTDVIWLQPLVVTNQPLTVHIAIKLVAKAAVEFTIYTNQQGKNKVVDFCQGQGRLSPIEETPYLDLANRFDPQGLEGQALKGLYQAFGVVKKDINIKLQPLMGVNLAASQPNELLASFDLSACVVGNDQLSQSFGLHPQLLSALDDLSKCVIGSQMPVSLHNIEFAYLKRLSFYQPLPAQVLAYLCYTGKGTLDITLCASDGDIYAKLQGVAYKSVDRLAKSAAGAQTNKQQLSTAKVETLPSGLTGLKPEWSQISSADIAKLCLDNKKITEKTSEDYGVVIIGGNDSHYQEVTALYPQARWMQLSTYTTVVDVMEQLQKVIASGYQINHLIWLVPTSSRVQNGKDISQLASAKEQQRSVMALFHLIKALLALDFGEKDLAWTVITEQGQIVHPEEFIEPAHAAVHGMVGVMAKEFKHWQVRLLDLPIGGEYLWQQLLTLPYCPVGKPMAYRNGEWFNFTVLPVYIDEPCDSANCYRHGGIYVVVGGAGGLGEAWSRWVIEHYQAQVIWLGRRAQNEEINAKIASAASLGVKPVYYQADGQDESALTLVNEQISAKFGRIDGVVLSALDSFDVALENMEQDRLEQVLGVKVALSIAVSKVFARPSLDFMLFFSSTSSFYRAGSFGGYSAGCAFADALAAQLWHQYAVNTQVVNWGYWSVGSGDRVTDEVKKYIEQNGVGSIGLEQGMTTLEQLLASDLPQLGVVNILKAQVLGEVEEVIKVYPKTIPALAFSPMANNESEELESNYWLANILITALESRIADDSDCQISILEIGAGSTSTSATTSATILKKLQNYRRHVAQYCYSDSDKAFLQRAQQHICTDNDFVGTALFNVAEPLAGQQIKANGYDVVIAPNGINTNGIDTSGSIRQSLRNIQAAMRANGLFVINPAIEVASSSLLSLDRWLQLLKQAGFDHVQLACETAQAGEQQLIIARSNGIARQSGVTLASLAEN